LGKEVVLLKKPGIFTLCIIFFAFLSDLALAQPSIISVAGTVATGSIITISGANMMDENKASWSPMFKGTSYSFEGSSPTSDGYLDTGDSQVRAVYDRTIKLMGSQSIKFHAEGQCDSNVGGRVPGDLGNRASASWFKNTMPEKYIRGYVRWHSVTNVWPKFYTKMLYAQESDLGPTGNWLVQPSGSRWLTEHDGTYYQSYDNPSREIVFDRWFCIEVRRSHVKPYRFTTWIDGVQIMDVAPPGPGANLYMLIGIINLCGTKADFSMNNWWDGFTISSSRVYPASVIEIGNSPDYATAKKVYQPPEFLSDSSIQIRVDLTGLGADACYLWVTNNRQQRSAAYPLCSAGG
jgi:hypothetical protein